MKCPNCNATLVMTERSGVEIDYCPECRGVWLDRGELDKIIERAAQPPSSSSTQNDQYVQKDRDHDRKYHEHDKGYYEHKKKKRGSFLDDLFDF